MSLIRARPMPVRSRCWWIAPAPRPRRSLPARSRTIHRGLIIGQTSFGKGTVQSVIPLDRWSSRPTEGQVTVTIGKFYRVTGESTQLRGVTPDIVLPSPISTEDVGESVLEHALPWDRIASVPFRALVARAERWCRRSPGEENDRAKHNADYQWLLASLDYARYRAQGENAVAESEEAPAGAHGAGSGASDAGKRAPQRRLAAGVEVG